MLNIFADALLIAAGFGTFPDDKVSRSPTREPEGRFPEKYKFRAELLRRTKS
jgi:hypothetical protein